MDLVTYAIPFFLLAIVVELAWDRWRDTGYYRSSDAINSLSLGILSTSSKLVIIDIGALVFTAVQNHLAIARWPLEGLFGAAIAFVLYDLCYYWFHRISHERKIFWAAHIVHHQSEEYNLTTALRQTSTGFLLSWLFYIPCFLLGMPTELFITVASANLIYQFWVHTRFVPELGPLEWILVTPSNHRVHHARNPDYLDRNYGGVFIIWDRLFGTYQRERADLPVDYGITTGLDSWNPLWANAHLYVDMLRQSLHTPRWRDKLTVWLSRTPDVAPGIIKPAARPGNRYNPAVSKTTRSYIAVHFAIALVLALLLEYTPMDRLTTIAAFALLCWSLLTIGWLQENRHAGAERARLVALLLGGLLMLAVRDEHAIGTVMIGIALLSWPALPQVTRRNTEPTPL